MSDCYQIEHGIILLRFGPFGMVMGRMDVTIFRIDNMLYNQSAGKRIDVHELRLPAINMSSFKVIHEDHRTYASTADVSIFIHCTC